jgi:glycine/D-amino acid oxidase-like deaminating enzyme/nitrite reductase/ring-hydroxylating ferredoxin subunit
MHAANAGTEQTTSLWMGTEVLPNASQLHGHKRCDTVIVGSGIAGLSCAYELLAAGQDVIVIDRGKIAYGMTARTTAHLAPICDDGLSALIDVRGEETAALFQKSQEAAVDRIEALVNEHNISCNFRRLDAFLFPALHMETGEAREQLEQEYKAARKAGAGVAHVKGVPLKGLEASPALVYQRQATFHPLKYLEGLVNVIQQKGGALFAHSPVVKVEELENGIRVTTETGASVTAAQAIFATNSPINDRVVLHSKMAPYRTYAMAFTIPRGVLPDALYWDLGDPYHYVRLHPGSGNIDYLIAGGADHKSGEANDGEARFEAVEAWIRSLVPDLGKIVHRWSGQVMETIDYCAFIGRNPGNENIYVITGDSGQGMTHGALSGLLLRDLIIKGESPWQKIYEPSRKTPSGVLNYLRENVTAVKNLAEHVLPGEISSLEELQPGQGGLYRDGISKLAAYRDQEGVLHLHSATCTHLGCVVHWNSMEKCWDCPCHGSQFAATGEVLNGPAIKPLAAHAMKGETSSRKTAHSG